MMALDCNVLSPWAQLGFVSQFKSAGVVFKDSTFNACGAKIGNVDAVLAKFLGELKDENDVTKSSGQCHALSFRC